MRLAGTARNSKQNKGRFVYDDFECNNKPILALVFIDHLQITKNTGCLKIAADDFVFLSANLFLSDTRNINADFRIIPVPAFIVVDFEVELIGPVNIRTPYFFPGFNNTSRHFPLSGYFAIG